ncbi:MAG: M81 family metallopeptidase [Clostridia bacterium]|nr:M81 family metallopeptidase [Clostridia bacterium]
MKIVIGSMQCEGNSLTPILTRYEDFDYAKGEAMYEKLKVMDCFKEANAEVIPTIYAHALPGGPVAKDDFFRLANELVDSIPESGFDGVWLFLHGAMCVEEIGSGDTYLVRKVREKVGKDIPISLALDFHADNTDEIIESVNYVTAFRTAPHTDHKDAQVRAAKALIKCIEKNILPRPQIARADVVICGDAVLTAEQPLKGIMEMADKLEKETDGILGVQVFNGQPWIDEPYMGPSFVVTHKSDTEISKEIANKLADKFYEVRHDFKFLVETAEPKEAIKMAMEDTENQVFLTDSGDNTTAGAVGDNAYMLSLLQEMGAKNVLLAGIADAEACDKCYKAQIGDTLTLEVGGKLDLNSKSTTITGKLIHRGNILSYTGGDAGESATLDCGDITVVITKNRASMCRPDIFESVDLDYSKYKIVVVKLGYLFPELASVAQRSILVFTPGCSTERLQDMNMKKIRRPMFPLDDDFK